MKRRVARYCSFSGNRHAHNARCVYVNLGMVDQKGKRIIVRALAYDAEMEQRRYVDL